MEAQPPVPHNSVNLETTGGTPQDAPPPVQTGGTDQIPKVTILVGGQETHVSQVTTAQIKEFGPAKLEEFQVAVGNAFNALPDKEATSLQGAAKELKGAKRHIKILKFKEAGKKAGEKLANAKHKALLSLSNVVQKYASEGLLIGFTFGAQFKAGQEHRKAADDLQKAREAVESAQDKLTGSAELQLVEKHKAAEKQLNKLGGHQAAEADRLGTPAAKTGRPVSKAHTKALKGAKASAAKILKRTTKANNITVSRQAWQGISKDVQALRDTYLSSTDTKLSPDALKSLAADLISIYDDVSSKEPLDPSAVWKAVHDALKPEEQQALKAAFNERISAAFTQNATAEVPFEQGKTKDSAATQLWRTNQTITAENQPTTISNIKWSTRFSDATNDAFRSLPKITVLGKTTFSGVGTTTPTNQSRQEGVKTILKQFAEHAVNTADVDNKEGLINGFNKVVEGLGQYNGTDSPKALGIAVDTADKTGLPPEIQAKFLKMVRTLDQAMSTGVFHAAGGATYSGSAGRPTQLLEDAKDPRKSFQFELHDNGGMTLTITEYIQVMDRFQIDSGTSQATITHRFPLTGTYRFDSSMTCVEVDLAAGQMVGSSPSQSTD